MVGKRVNFSWSWMVLLALGLLGLAAQFGVFQDPYAQSFLLRNQAPSIDHWLGTDLFGRDLLARLAHGAWITLSVALGATLTALLCGAVTALIACVVGGWFRAAIFSVFDLLRTLPSILLGLVIMTSVGAGTSAVIMAIGITFAPLFAYVTAGAYDRERVAAYMVSARLLGGSRFGVIYKHLVPNIAGTLLVQIVIVIPRAITTESVLSFLGLGVAPDTPTWGRIIATSSDYAEQAPWGLVLPVACLALTTLALSILGQHIKRKMQFGLDEPQRSRDE
ncbi:ABC transporter permease [Alcaligenes aquatilis]|uniref:ABC transporter permease n=1 Tax=Alcaligenes aquatilis TaxID=323284 RepID=A0A3G2HZ98_9BURK|nr:ABC transporter permease [Alcaligenes aquatilis]AYN22404.1 ABC transporter permease [Alcaligenes aquatilis]